MASQRLNKVNHLIRDEVGAILRDGLDFNDEVLVTVVGVETSSTLEHATVRVSVIPDNREGSVMKRLKKEVYDVQQELNKRIVIRPVPKIRFEIDRSGEHVLHIEKLLENQ